MYRVRVYGVISYCLIAAGTPQVSAEEIFIPRQFQQGQTIEQVILISDVDGVVRDNVEEGADSKVIASVKSLLNHSHVDIAFLSGTPVVNDLSLEEWRRGNVALNQVFHSAFDKELEQGNVAIYGLCGGHRLKCDGSLEVLEEYNLQVSFELGRLLIQAFLQEVLLHGSSDQKQTAESLYTRLEHMQLRNVHQSILATPEEFEEVIMTIRKEIDPCMRMMSSSCAIEMQFSSPEWTPIYPVEWVTKEMRQPSYLISQISPQHQQVISGIARRNGKNFNFIVVSTTNKGISSEKHLSEKVKMYPNALIITIGDTQGDFPMHQHAHLAFHVGFEEIWRKNAMQHCIMVRSSDGKDSQHVKGTLKVLELLEEAVGKPFDEFRYIPRQNACGEWDYYSLKDLNI